ncbi:MAG: UvrD-helicase domain-containing protein, partial [Planctomycetota bacterium]
PDKRWEKAVTKLVEATEREEWDTVLGQGLGKAFLGAERSYCNAELSEELCGALTPIVRRATHAWLTGLRTRNLATRAWLEHFETAYAERKRKSGTFCFDDVPQALAPLGAEELPIDARQLDLWFRLDGKIDHLLLDEFQDTSPIQWRVLAHIAEEIVADGTRERSFFCVGDLKQSIYGFRQAEPRLLEKLPELLPGLEPEAMDLSYRSSRIVLETVNRVFSELAQNPTLAGADLEPYRVAAASWQGRFHEHQAGKQLPGATYLLEARQAAEGEAKDFALLERTVERAVAICTEAPGATVGILLREGVHIPDLIHRLRRENIDASGEGGNALTDSEAVLAFLSLLHLADHPGDTAAAFHVGNSRFGEYVELSQDANRERQRTLAREIRRRLSTEGLGAVCAGFARRVAADGGWSDWDRARFTQLEELSFAFEAESGPRPSDFVDHVRLEGVEAPGGARVRVMTIHRSKGLEFDAVILPLRDKPLVGRRSGLLVQRPTPDGPIRTVTLSPKKELLAADGELRGLYDQTTGRMLEDELSILYVAMTRAARRLDLILPWTDPDKQPKVPSAPRFLRSSLPHEELSEPDGSGVIWSHPENAPGAGWADELEVEREQREPVPPLTTLGLAPAARPRALPRRSPSAEEGGIHVRASDLLRPRRAAQRGTLVHAWLEDLEWVEDFSLDQARLLEEGARLEPDLETRRSALAELSAALECDEVRRALAREHCRAPADCTLEVRSEHAFSVVLGDGDSQQLWTGSIDRLILARRGNDVVWAEVLDYKTDQVSEEELPSRVEYYAPQLRSYARVVAAQTGLDPCHIPLRLVFLGAGRVVEMRVDRVP